jgi:hypothetical protein
MLVRESTTVLHKFVNLVMVILIVLILGILFLFHVG